MPYKILLVEDDLSISEMVQNYLQKEGYEINPGYNGEQALELFRNQTHDLIILDLMLPKLNGIDFLKIVRERSLIPILILSAKDGEVDKALGLGFGADDYLSKPFSLIELSARVKAAIRRATQYASAEKKDQVIKIGDLTLNVESFSLHRDIQEIQLTLKEFHILKLFFSNPKRVFTKAQIYSSVWNEEYFGDENVINVHMRRLREKIEDDPSQPKYIQTLWGIGYKLGDF
ncbi:response regulator transcription factor [Bacillus sp. 03113]|uniref:response regulator transcription factor n=1 Tax=Bacillus sp. 03113 TaxID=2578211 RepID=UPI00114507D9|nr:response regulator transcription factor [Bacillus sp. 03113]